jgi:hypothetical protein
VLVVDAGASRIVAGYGHVNASTEGDRDHHELVFLCQWQPVLGEDARKAALNETT